jgi:hypothetical protein
VGSDIWFSTVANTLCLVLDSFYGTPPAPFQNSSWVCDMPDGEDFKPPRMYVYDSATSGLTDLTSKVLAGGGAARLSKTYGLRSAGAYKGVVFFGGLYSPSSTKISVVLYAFDAQTQRYLGSYLFDGSDEQHPLYNNIRQWHVISDQLFTGMGKPGGGAILRWTGSLANPFSFAVVGQLAGDPAYFTEHKGNIYVSTWGSNGTLSGMSLYMSPTLHDALGLEETDAANWTEVWNINNYEVEPTAVQGGGAIVSFGGYLYWGTMDVPGTGLVAFKKAYPDAVIDSNAFINTYRPIVLFRSQGFDPAQVGTPAVDLLYGSAQLPQYDPAAGVWNMVNNNMGKSPLYGPAGFGNFFNNYTWSMEIYQGKLYVGTMDWSFLAGNSGLQTQFPPAIQAIAPRFYGADLWSFADSSSPAVPVSIDGMGNNSSYGIRNMMTLDDTLWIGMANPMNLRSDPSDNPGGWKLLSFQTQRAVDLIDWFNPADVTYGTPLNATQLNATAHLSGAIAYTPPAGTVLDAGLAQPLTATLTPTNSGNQYSKTVNINVNRAPVAATAANASMVYGAAMPALTGSLTGVVNGDAITATYSTTASTTSPVGTYPITPALNDPNSRLSNYSVTPTNGTLTISKAGTTSSVTASAGTTFLQKQVTFTAHVVSATTSTPTGSVNFMDGTSSLGSAALDNSGNATLPISTLAVGSHQITAAYAGDGNFSASTSSAIGAVVQDFQLGTGSDGLSATTQQGGTATFTFTLSPTNGNAFPNDIVLTLSGLPAGATATITPSTILAGSGAQTVTIQVHTGAVAAVKSYAPGGLTFALVFLPIAGLLGFRRRRGTALLVLLVCALGILLPVAGCGGKGANITTRPLVSYTMTLNAASGTLQHSMPLVLTVN